MAEVAAAVRVSIEAAATVAGAVPAVGRGVVVPPATAAASAVVAREPVV